MWWGLAPPEFARFFASKDAAAAAPEQALLIAATEVLIAITHGRGVISRDRMLAMAEIVTAHPNLRKQASSTRKRVLTQALADRLGVAAENRRAPRGDDVVGDRSERLPGPPHHGSTLRPGPG